VKNPVLKPAMGAGEHVVIGCHNTPEIPDTGLPEHPAGSSRFPAPFSRPGNSCTQSNLRVFFRRGTCKDTLGSYTTGPRGIQ